MVRWRNTLLLGGVVVGLLLLSLGILLGSQTDEPVLGWIKLVLLPGTFAALVFPGVHADRFICAVIFFNLLIYETPIVVALVMIRRKIGHKTRPVAE